MSLWLGDQDAQELLKSRGSREKTRTRVKRFTVVCERSETITSVRNVPERNERGRRADADRVKHRLSVRNVPKRRIEATAALLETVTRGRRTAAGRQQINTPKGTARNGGDLQGLSGMSDPKKGSPEQ